MSNIFGKIPFVHKQGYEKVPQIVTSQSKESFTTQCTYRAQRHQSNRSPFKAMNWMDR